MPTKTTGFEYQIKMANWRMANPHPVPNMSEYQVTSCAAQLPEHKIIELRRYESQREEAEFFALYGR